MSIATRLWIALIFAVTFVLSVDGAIRIREERELLLEATLRDRRFFGEAIQTAVEASPDPHTAARALVADDVLRDAHIEVRIIEGSAAPEWVGRIEDDEVRERFRDGKVIGVATSDRVRTLIPVQHDAQTLSIELDEPSDVHAAIEKLSVVTTLWSSLALSVLAGIATWVITRWLIGAPLARLAAQARRIGRGDLTARLDVERDDEVAVLAREMNEMAHRLETTRKALDEATTERVALQETLRHDDRLRTVGQLAAALAHELGTPLNTVAGHARLIERNRTVDEPAHKSAQVIGEQTERMAKLIRDLLDFGRPSTAERRMEDLVTLANKTVEMLEPLARKHHATLSVRAQQSVSLKLDPSAFLQVLTNLVVNAIQSMPKGGPVVVEVDMVQRKPPADIPERATTFARVRVIDRGTGIAKEDLAHVMEPFFTRKSPGEGTGLGLPVVKGIVEDHGGWLEIESEQETGTTVSVLLPLHSA